MPILREAPADTQYEPADVGANRHSDEFNTQSRSLPAEASAIVKQN